MYSAAITQRAEGLRSTNTTADGSSAAVGAALPICNQPRVLTARSKSSLMGQAGVVSSMRNATAPVAASITCNRAGEEQRAALQ